jgi:hypothetical protein
VPPRAANHAWAYDFVFDSCANGQQLKCLTIVDEFTHQCLAIDVAGSIRSARVIEVLTRLMSAHGTPVYSQRRSPIVSPTARRCPLLRIRGALAHGVLQGDSNPVTAAS